ncbi:MAG: hypothetical protein RLZZ308_546 [Candidatus Parcubacteria bacterium]|jgi:hypothetical protein
MKTKPSQTSILLEPASALLLMVYSYVYPLQNIIKAVEVLFENNNLLVLRVIITIVVNTVILIAGVYPIISVIQKIYRKLQG